MAVSIAQIESLESVNASFSHQVVVRDAYTRLDSDGRFVCDYTIAVLMSNSRLRRPPETDCDRGRRSQVYHLGLRLLVPPWLQRVKVSVSSCRPL